MSDQKPPTAKEIAVRQAELCRIAQRFAATYLRRISRADLLMLTMMGAASVEESDLQAIEDELTRIIHYLERGRR